MPNLRGSEWLIIILLLALLFGAKRLPDAARSVGRSLRIFKAETKGLMDDGQPADAPATVTPAQVITPAPAPSPGAPTPAPVVAPATPVTAPAPVSDNALRPESPAAPPALQPPTQA